MLLLQSRDLIGLGGHNGQVLDGRGLTERYKVGYCVLADVHAALGYDDRVTVAVDGARRAFSNKSVSFPQNKDYVPD